MRSFMARADVAMRPQGHDKIAMMGPEVCALYRTLKIGLRFGCQIIRSHFIDKLNLG